MVRACFKGKGMSVFDLDKQNSNLDKKIVAGLERLSQVFRTLLWEQAKNHSLSPIQIQLLIFIHYHSPDKTTVSYLAQEFQLTKPTISDAVKSLEQKSLIRKVKDDADTRSYTIQLTPEGRQAVADTEVFADPLAAVISGGKEADKKSLWGSISLLIRQLQQAGIISIQRSCTHCRYYSSRDNKPFCALVEQRLLPEDFRIDCPEFEPHK